GDAQGTKESSFNDQNTPLVQVVYLSQVKDGRYLQEIVNAVRSIVDIQRFFPIHQRAIVMRALPDQVKAADWLINILDRDPEAQTAGGAPLQYQLDPAPWIGRGGLTIQVVPLVHANNPQMAQDLVNVTRSVADVQRMFPVDGFVVMRADDAQTALVNWMFKEL